MSAQYSVPPAGSPCWFDLTTPDLEASQVFYSSLLGWGFSGAGPMGMGSAAVVDGSRVAGLSPQPEGQSAPAFWTLYFRVEGFDDVMDRLDSAQGRALMAVPGFDTDCSVALVMDPAGTAFGVLEYPDDRGMGAFGTPGAVAWAELFHKNPSVLSFYSQMFGWEFSSLSQTEDQDYRAFSLGSADDDHAAGKDVHARGDGLVRGGDHAGADGGADASALGGLLDASALEVPAHWEAHFRVDDVDALAETVIELGGDVLAAPHDSLHGRVGRFVDPQSAAFTLVTPH